MSDKPIADSDTARSHPFGDARDWLAGPLGSLLLSEERLLLADELSHYFGSYLVHFGPPLELPAGVDQLRHGIRLAPTAEPGVDIVCDEGAWPLEEHAVDVALLQHALDFSVNPHQLLREAARSVRPGGHLLIVGVNPWSLWGGRHLVAGDALRQARCIAPARVADWLSLLGFKLEHRRFGCYRPPLASPAWQRRLAWMDRDSHARQGFCAGFYLLSARKLMVGLQPLPKSRKEALGKLVPLPVASPTTTRGAAVSRRSRRERS